MQPQHEHTGIKPPAAFAFGSAGFDNGGCGRMTILKTIEELEKHYGTPGEASIVKETDHLTAAYRSIIEASRFCALATSGPEGLDCSPRGDADPAVSVKDEKTLILPDRRGNNRIDSLRNIINDPRVALMFMVPGWENVLRINGHAVISVEPDLLTSLEADGKAPRSCIIITVDAVYFQCARAIMRAGLWQPDSRATQPPLPTPGQIMEEIKSGFDGETYDRQWGERAKATMW